MITKLKKNLAQVLFIGAGLLCAVNSMAQEARWFRVELLIFSNESATAINSEVWEPTPALAYPDQRRFLLDPAAIENNTIQYHATSMVDDYGYQTLTVIAPPAEEEGSEDPIEQEAAEEPTEEAVDVIPPSTPTPFTLLPHSELEFRGKAAYMQRTGRYQTLFHESWLQPFASRNDAIPIVLDRSGDNEGWPRLQGSVKLYLSRYLHIETNLWLNTRGSYLPPQWQMPAPPFGPKSLSIIYPPEPAPEPELEPEPGLDPEDDAIPETSEELPDADLAPAVPISPWRHAILLQQERRMRSTEVHYIDHPMLGVVIKVSPITDEELLERASAAAAVAAQSAP